MDKYNTEVWEDIDGYVGVYQVSNLGRVKSLDRVSRAGKNLKGKVLKNKIVKGYHVIGLYKKGKQSYKTVSRLVAKAFIPNPYNKPEVNHVDEDKNNNRAKNLEWVTAKENSNHGTRNERLRPYQIQNGKRRRKPVAMLDINTKEVLVVFESINAAYRRIGIRVTGNISTACKNGEGVAYGHRWRYFK